jgi:cold shock CspA family protein
MLAESDAIGTVKYWRDERGHGAIATDRTAPWDIWCSFSAIEGTGYRALRPGERVAVRYRRADQGSFRFVAVHVRRLQPKADEATSTPPAG